VKRLLAMLTLAALAPGLALSAGAETITLASTTSTENSGLFAHLLPRFEAASGIGVNVVAVGSGAAFKIGERGDADVLLVHDPVGEEAFVAAGFGIDRRAVMYNDFVVVGPKSDPAGIAGGSDAVAAFRALADQHAQFYSRGDDSGTHRAERRIWTAAGIDPSTASGEWYFETGSGMGATLNTAAAQDGHALADRGTWLSFKNRRDLALLVAGDERLYNPYSVILVNPARHLHVKQAPARAFMDWLTGPDGQAAIDDFTVAGERLFFPNAGRSKE